MKTQNWITQINLKEGMIKTLKQILDKDESQVDYRYNKFYLKNFRLKNYFPDIKENNEDLSIKVYNKWYEIPFMTPKNRFVSDLHFYYDEVKKIQNMEEQMRQNED